LLTKPWREVLGLIADGRAPQPPVAHLCGRRLLALEEGRAALAIPASEWFCGPKGRVDSGMFAFLADMTHFYAVLSTLPAGGGCTTAELSMTFLGQPPYAGGQLTASSEVVYADDRNALALAVVCGDHGQPVAHSTSRYFLFPAGAVNPRRSPRSSAAAMRSPAADPVFRPCDPTFSPLDDRTLDRLSGLEILRAELAGERSPPPIDRLTGIRLTDAADGQVVFSLPAHGWLLQEIGTVFGGMIALLAKGATAGAVQAAASAGTRFTAPRSQGELPPSGGGRRHRAFRRRQRGSSRQPARDRQYEDNPRRADRSDRDGDYRPQPLTLPRSPIALATGPTRVPAKAHGRARAGHRAHLRRH